MTVNFTCNCCGRSVDVPDDKDESVTPPKNWRSIRTVIDHWVGESTLNTYESSNVHSCDDCNAHMEPLEHIDAEYDHRVGYMAQNKGLK